MREFNVYSEQTIVYIIINNTIGNDNLIIC